jgi:uncharacterized membrane protein
MKKFWTILRIAGTCIGAISCLLLIGFGEFKPITSIQILKVGFALLFIGSAGILSAIVADRKLQKYKLSNYRKIFSDGSKLSHRLFMK